MRGPGQSHSCGRLARSAPPPWHPAQAPASGGGPALRRRTPTHGPGTVGPAGGRHRQVCLGLVSGSQAAWLCRKEGVCTQHARGCPPPAPRTPHPPRCCPDPPRDPPRACGSPQCPCTAAPGARLHGASPWGPACTAAAAVVVPALPAQRGSWSPTPPHLPREPWAARGSPGPRPGRTHPCCVGCGEGVSEDLTLLSETVLLGGFYQHGKSLQ